jgi:hypothetical protein
VDRRQLAFRVGEQVIEAVPHRRDHMRATVPKGAVLTITFPVARHTKVEDVLDVDYTTQWAGDTVVGIEPAGTQAPLYRGGERTAGVLAISSKSAGARTTSSNSNRKVAQR